MQRESLRFDSTYIDMQCFIHITDQRKVRWTSDKIQMQSSTALYPVNFFLRKLKNGGKMAAIKFAATNMINSIGLLLLQTIRLFLLGHVALASPVLWA